MTQIDSSALLALFGAQYSQTGGGASGGAATAASTAITAATQKYAPTPPWDPSRKQPAENDLVATALRGSSIVNPNAAQLDLAGAGGDYKNLFALYQGLSTLYALADQASATGVSKFRMSQLTTAFAQGYSQVTSFVGDTNFNKLRLTTGATSSSATTAVSTPAQATEYETVALNTSGDSSAVVPAFQGAVQFDVTVKLGSKTSVVHMDLSDMGSAPRTMGNVVSYLNGQLKAAGAIARFESARTPAQPHVIQVNGKDVTLSSGTATWGLQLNTDPFETVTLSAPTTAPAVYVGEMVGNLSAPITSSSLSKTGGSSSSSSSSSSGNSTGNTTTSAPTGPDSQLLKFQAGNTTITAPAPGSNAAPNQVFKDDLGNTVNQIQETATAPDGSVFVLANVNATASGDAVTGGQDVALLKYDSAGKLLFQSNLGSVSKASGLALAVSADGSKVAVAGSIVGPLNAVDAVSSSSSNTNPDSFVAVFDSQGDQLWSHETDGYSANQATGVAFGADGTVYVTGQQATAVGGSLGPTTASNAYLQAFTSAGKTLSTTRFGAGTVNASAGIAVDGTNVYIAGTQDGRAVVTEYDMSAPKTPSLIATRDLGDLQGGNVAGIAVQGGTVYVAGSTHNSALSAGAVTSAYSAGLDGFAATLSTGLAASSSDRLAYYGGGGDDKVSAFAVSGGEVWLTGSSTGDLPNQAKIGAKDGFVAEVNVGSGSVDFSQRFTGRNGQVNPTSIAVAPTGSSILDQLGLPQGVVDGPVSDLITATTSVKAGDSFSIKTNAGVATKITISATDTMKTLATKISRATGYGVHVTAQTLGGSSTLKIEPIDPSSTVTLISGPKGTDALSELGLKPGILYDTIKQKGSSVPADGRGPVFGLGLDATLSLSSPDAIKHAMAQLTAAKSMVKNAYQALKTAATPANVLALQKSQASGAVPAYLTAQIANYQAALQRLTAGQSAPTTIFGI